MSFGLEIRNKNALTIFSTEYYVWKTHSTIQVPRLTSGSTDFPELVGKTLHAVVIAVGVPSIIWGCHRTSISGTRVYWNWVDTFAGPAASSLCFDSYVHVYYR